jgi:glyoxylase-like metal-dependent hydrolase (beta-lactamase superfamily II)
MLFHALTLGDIAANCYLLAEEPPAALVIDPGDEPEKVVARLEAAKLTPAWIVNTHGHGDHIGANAGVRARYPEVKIAVGRGDEKMLPSPARNLSFFTGGRVRSPKADRVLEDGDLFEFARWTFRVIGLPGHTRGGIGLFTEDLDGGPALFSGDAIFREGIGRSDLPGGDGDLLVRGLEEKVLTLPANTVIYPGHGPATTVAHEKANNPFLGG